MLGFKHTPPINHTMNSAEIKSRKRPPSSNSENFRRPQNSGKMWGAGPGVRDSSTGSEDYVLICKPKKVVPDKVASVNNSFNSDLSHNSGTLNF